MDTFVEYEHIQGLSSGNILARLWLLNVIHIYLWFFLLSELHINLMIQSYNKRISERSSNQYPNDSYHEINITCMDNIVKLVKH